MRKEVISIILCFAFIMGMTGCAQNISENYTFEPHKVIIDTDTGGDDAIALILAARSENIQILGVTTLAGNVSLEQSTQNALMALEVGGCDASVYRGSDHDYLGNEIMPFSVFGNDGMGDEDLVHPTGTAKKASAVDFILRTVKENPYEVEIISLGPATNIALAMEREPATMAKVKRIWSMGTSGYGMGNATPVAEFNVYKDAAAYKRMLEGGVEVTVVSFDLCRTAQWTEEDFEDISKLNETGSFVEKCYRKVREYEASNGLADGTCMTDVLAMMCVVCTGFVKDQVRCYASCITDPGETYGQVIFYRESVSYNLVDDCNDYNVMLVTEVDGGAFYKLFKEKII